MAETCNLGTSHEISTSAYQIWVVASRAFPEKSIGTAISSSVEDCQKECPSLFFFSQEDADSYRNKLDPELKKSFKTYSATIRVDKPRKG